MTFTSRGKIALLATAIVIFFLAVLLAVLPTVLVNRPDTRGAIQRYLSAAIGGEVGFDQLKLTLFPKVCVTIGRARLELPEKVAVRAVEIDVCLQLLPLVRGRVVAGSIKAQSPEIRLPMAPIDSAGSDPGFPDPRLLVAWMAARVKQLPESAIELIDGRLFLFGPDGNRFEFRNLNLRFHHSGGELGWALRGEADFLKAFAAAGRLDTDSLKGTATLQVTDFRPRSLCAYFWPGARFQVLDSRADLDITLILDGPEQLKAVLKAKAPVLALSHDRRETGLSIDRLAAEVELSPKRLAVSIPDLAIGEPRAFIKASLVIDEEIHPRIAIRLEGRGDATGARQAALALLHDSRDAQQVFDILRGGEVPSIVVNLHGDAWSEVTDQHNLLIKGRLENGRVYIPWIDLDVNAVYGEVLIAGGILEGRNLKASYRGTRGENGTLRVGLSLAEPVLQLDIFAHAELSALPPLLARVVSDSVFRKEVALLQEFSGTAQGTLRLNGSHTEVAVEVQASDLDVKARHQNIAYPLRFQGGELAYDGDSISLRGVDVTIGDSKLFKHDLTLGLNGNLPLQSSSPKAVIDLAEMFNLFRDRPPFNHLRRLEGAATFNNWQLSGQAFVPDTWRLISTGTVEDLSVESELMPGPLSLASSRFDWMGQTIRYQSARGSVSRSEIEGLAVDADWTGPVRVQVRALELDASIDDIAQVLQSFPKTAAHVAALSPVSGTARMLDVGFEARLLPEGPAIDQFEAVLKESVITSAKMDLPLTLTNGAIGWRGSNFELQISKASLGQSEIQNISVSKNWSIDGGLKIRGDKAVIECGEIFPRMVSLVGMERLLEDVRDLRGTVAVSDVHIEETIRDPARWRLEATTELKGIVITTTFLDEPIGIPEGRLTIADSERSGTGSPGLKLEAARLTLGTDEATVSGSVTLSPTETLLSLDVVAEKIDWNKIEKTSDRIAKHRKADSRPLRGRLNLRVKRLAIDRFYLDPFYAGALLAPEETRIEIERAGLCGMTFIGRMAFDATRVNAYLVPVVDVAQLDSVVACLSDERSLFSGNFNLQGQLSFNARREDIVRALNGRLTFVAEDGTIRKSLLFARLFSLLNLTEIYRGKLPDFSSQGLDFKRSTAILEVKEGKILVNDWSIDGRTLWMGSRGEIDIASQQIDFTIMVSPFKTIDRIINSIPGLRWILGGRLVAIPMKAIGSLEDPQIVPLSPTAVGTSILEMIERTLLLPIEIIQPLVPGIEETPSSTISR